MNNEEMLNKYGLKRIDKCREISERLKSLNKEVERLQRKAYWAKTAEPDERVNIGMFDVEELESRLSLIRKDVAELEKINAVLDFLRDVK